MSEGRSKAGRVSRSWLIRCWEEPRESPQGDPVLRGFVRDLKTGEEHYLNDPRELGEIVTREMQEPQPTAEEGTEDAKAGD